MGPLGNDGMPIGVVYDSIDVSDYHSNRENETMAKIIKASEVVVGMEVQFAYGGEYRNVLVETVKGGVITGRTKERGNEYRSYSIAKMESDVLVWPAASEPMQSYRVLFDGFDLTGKQFDTVQAADEYVNANSKLAQYDIRVIPVR